MRDKPSVKREKRERGMMETQYTPVIASDWGRDSLNEGVYMVGGGGGGGGGGGREGWECLRLIVSY